MSETKSKPAVTIERRSNTALRSLVDAMLERVREAQRNSAAWSPEERQRAEQDLAAIMERVRHEATKPAPPGAPHVRNRPPTSQG